MAKAPAAPKASTKPKTTPAAAAPKTAPKAAPVAAAAPEPEPEPDEGVAYAAGDFVRFVGYAELSPDVAPLYEPGDKLEITEVKEDDSFLVVKVGTELGDTAFPDEIEPWTDEHEAALLAGDEADEEVAEEDEEAVAEGEAEETEEVAEDDEAETAEAEAGTEVAADGEGELNEEEARENLDTAKQLSETLEEAYFALAGVLTAIYQGGHYRLAGYASGQFEQYLLNDLGATVSYRKALQLIEIHETLAPLEIDRDRLKEIGWTKAREIVARMKGKPELLQEKFDEIIDLAKTKTREELGSEIRTTYLGETVSTSTTTTTTDEGAGEQTRMDSLRFKLFEDQAKTVSEVLESVKTKNELPDLSAALHLVIVEWAQLSEGVEVSLPDAISAMQTRYNVTVTAKPVKKAAATTAAAAPAATTKPAATAKPAATTTAAPRRAAAPAAAGKPAAAAPAPAATSGRRRAAPATTAA